MATCPSPRPFFYQNPSDKILILDIAILFKIFQKSDKKNSLSIQPLRAMGVVNYFLGSYMVLMEGMLV